MLPKTIVRGPSALLRNHGSDLDTQQSVEQVYARQDLKKCVDVEAFAEQLAGRDFERVNKLALGG